MTAASPSWDALTLFQGLLDRWPDLLDRSRRLRTSDHSVPMTLRAAVIGFSLFHPIQEWSRANFEFIDGYLNGQPPLDSFSPSPECSEAHRVFGCLGLGALLGKFNAGEIDDEQAAKGEWSLMAFLSLHGRDVCDGYKVAERAWQSDSI